MDIAKAYMQEVEYRTLRAYGKEPVSLLERVKACGFNTLEEYFAAKIDYQIENTTFSYKEVYPENAAEEMLKMIANGGAGVLLMNTDKTVVYHGNDNYNVDYCKAHNIPVIEYKTNGGTLVASAGELSIGVNIPNSIDVTGTWFLNKIANILKKYMDNVTVDNNDILIDGLKVCGMAAYHSETAFCAIAQFSFDDKTELIENICGINPKKRPSYIKDMTREELRKEIKAWL